MPAQLAACLINAGVAGSDIAGPARNNPVGHRHAIDTLEGRNHVQYRMAAARPEVLGDNGPVAFTNHPQPVDMALCEVSHMDIVPHPSAVRSVIVAPIN